MSTLNPQAQALIQQFGQQPGVTPDNVANLQTVLNSSPALIDQVNKAAASGELKKFELLAPGTNAGGTYNPNTQVISLPSAMLTTQPGKPLDMGEPVFVLGHELQHGLNRADTKKAYDQSQKEMEAEARRPAASHDYTPMAEKRVAQNRRDEASAEIAGFNALAGMVKSANPKATLADVYKENPSRMGDFIDFSSGRPATYTLKPNLTANPDMTLSTTPANVEAMGKNYFDKSATSSRIGHHGNSDYTNYYAASAIGLAVRSENAHAKPYNGVQPRMIVDMQKLGLSEKLLEENGLFLGQGQPTPRPYYDSSKTPHTFASFRPHHADTHACARRAEQSRASRPRHAAADPRPRARARPHARARVRPAQRATQPQPADAGQGQRPVARRSCPAEQAGAGAETRRERVRRAGRPARSADVACGHEDRRCGADAGGGGGAATGSRQPAVGAGAGAGAVAGLCAATGLWFADDADVIRRMG
jgi:hypothetical protein